MNKHLHLALAATFALGMVAHAPPAEARNICKIIDVFRDASDCERRCREIMNTPAKERVAKWWNTSFYPHDVTETPWQIFSCKVTPSPEFQGACRMTFCGPVHDVYEPLRKKSPRIAQPQPKPKVGPPGPGLLERDQGGFTRQAPSAIGTPLRSGAPSGGGSAPAAGGGLR
jgi:hypothetical protein